MPALRPALKWAVTTTAATLAVAAMAAPAQAQDTTPPPTPPEKVDLVVSPANATVHVRLGEVPQVPLEVRNTGTKPLPGVVLALRTRDRYNMPLRWSNCSTKKDGPSADYDDYMTVCRFDGAIAPGVTYHLADQPFHKAIAPEDWGPFQYSQRWYTIDDAIASNIGLGTTPGAPLLRLSPELAPATPGGFTDSDTSNNTGKGIIVIDFTSPSPSPSPTSASASPSASTSGSVPGSATPSTSGAAAGGTGGGLPITGANATLIGGAGAALLAAGLVLYLTARRRRNSFTA